MRMSRMSRSPIAPALLCLMLTLAPASAIAQPTPAPKPPAARPGAAAAQSAAAQPATPEAPAPMPRPRAIEISDPMLGPVPASKKMLSDWKQILTLLNSRSTDITIADLEIERARGLARQALGRALPTIVAQGLLEHERTRGDGTPIGGVGTGGPGSGTTVAGTGHASLASASLTASQPVLALRTWHAIGTANLNVKAAKYDADDRRRLVLAAVADSILSVVTAERLSEINRVGLRSSLERLELTQRRARLGTGTKLDIVRAEQDATLARTQLIAGDQGLLQAREALGLALGSSEAYGVPPTISINEVEQSLKNLCASGKTDQRSDVMAASTDVEIAERQVREAKLGWAPTAEIATSLEAFARTQTSSAAGLDVTSDQRQLAWSIRGVLTIPIWDGGSRYGEIRSAKAVAEQQKARLDATRRTAEIEVVQAMRTVAAAEQARVLAEKGRDLARETSRLSQIAFEAGTATSFELVEAGRAERQAELDLAVREFELIQAKLSALLATASCKY
jgi:outer membrane protein TolC